MAGTGVCNILRTVDTPSTLPPQKRPRGGHDGRVPVPSDRPPVDRSLLRDDVYRRLRDGIIDGTFAPGEQLKDGELATWLGVSRTPVREALLRLAHCGLVVARPGRSTVVSSLDERATRDARDVVAAMHELAVRAAVPQLTSADIDAMRDAARRFSDALDDGDIDVALSADDELHAVPVTVAGNRAVAAVLEQHMPVLRRIERVRFASADGRRSPDRHEDLIRLCAAGDVDGAAAVAFETWHSLPTSAS
ncbi:GntR family transcriptional regulator [Cellulomonas sp. zg-ZUI188]|uniref:GntR family transcriptional regulator n=1 Tax=Cellulomonas fengjieae TaxID=2819978 RepID=A0ABS3SM63_9CELL|nr:GntR family transcriptional regulator [Cellulomonas fengjieae]QVI68051.1 GntR family transcriptional regulator [Cellulomonas fengjieae]